MALVAVIGALALATVMAMAMLSSAAVNAQMKSRALSSAQAQFLAESGVSLALYYLQYPSKAPVLVSNVYPGETGLTFGSSVPGSVNVTVTAVGTDLYDVTATAQGGANTTSSVTRQVRSRVQVQRAYLIDKAASFITGVTVPAGMTINGDVRCDGSLNNQGTITGAIMANTLTGGGGSSLSTVPTYPTRAVPTMSQLSLNTTLGATTPHYTYTDANGQTQTGYAELLPATVTGTVTASPTNPKSVWYINNNLTIQDATIDGTIVVRGAGRVLNVAGKSRITPRANMPALIVSSSIRFAADATTKELVVDGLCYTGNQVTTTTGGPATNADLIVNGAFMASGPSSTIVAAAFSGTIKVNYVPGNVQIPELSSTNRVPQSVRVVDWSQ